MSSRREKTKSGPRESWAARGRSANAHSSILAPRKKSGRGQLQQQSKPPRGHLAPLKLFSQDPRGKFFRGQDSKTNPKKGAEADGGLGGENVKASKLEKRENKGGAKGLGRRTKKVMVELHDAAGLSPHAPRRELCKKKTTESGILSRTRTPNSRPIGRTSWESVSNGNTRRGPLISRLGPAGRGHNPTHEPQLRPGGKTNSLGENAKQGEKANLGQLINEGLGNELPEGEASTSYPAWAGYWGHRMPASAVARGEKGGCVYWQWSDGLGGVLVGFWGVGFGWFVVLGVFGGWWSFVFFLLFWKNRGLGRHVQSHKVGISAQGMGS